jgi:hypothetical protein
VFFGCQSREISEEGLDWGHLDGGVDPSVVHEGGDCQPLAPVVLLSGCYEAEVLFHPLILSF